MNDHLKTKADLIKELESLRMRLPEETLLEELTRRQILFDQSPDGVLVIDPQTAGFIEFNTAAHEQLGYTRDEFAKLTIPDIEALETAAETQKSIAKVLQAGKVDFETLQRTKQGEIRHVHVTAQMVDAKGDPIYYCIWRDISERKGVEAALIESEERLNLFFEQSLDGFFFMMLDEPLEWNETINKELALDYAFSHQRVTKINDAMLAQYLATRDEFMHLTPNDFFAHDIESGRQVWRQFFDTGKLHIETNERRFDGSEMFIEGDYICLYDSKKRITGHFGIQRDISQSKHAATALQQSEEKYRTLSLLKRAILESPDGIIVFALDKNYCYLDFTSLHQQTMQMIWGVRIEQGDNMLECIKNTADREKAQKNFDRALQGERFLMEEEYGDQELKRTFYEDRYGPVLDENGDIMGISVFVIDIAKRMQAEETLRDSETLLRTMAENYPNSYVSIIEKDLTIGFNAGQEFKKQNLDPNDYVGLTLEQVFGTNSALVKEKYLQTFDGMETQFELFVNDQYQYYRTVPLLNQDGGVSRMMVVVENITERKLAEKDLQELQAKQSAMIANISDVIGIIGTDGIMKYKSPNIEKWFGWKPEELLGTDGFITVHPDDLERVKNEFVTLLGVEASVKTLEYRYKCKDGSFKPIELTATNLINDPIIQGVLLNYHDISDRNEMDDKLRSSEETFRKAFTTSPDSININRLDDGKYISINQGFTNITGFTEADVQGKSSLEINIWDNPEDREKLAAGLRAHGEVKNLATRFRTKTGGILYGLMSASIMELDGIKHILSITRDITLRERTNRERKRLSAAIEQSTDTIVITDLDGTIIYVNSAFGHSSGYTAEEAVGNNPRVLKSGKHETSFYKQIWDTILNGKTWQGRMINKKKDGSLYTEEASISPVRDSSGSIINFVAVKHDITEHLLLEARLHQSQKLEAIGTMVGGISHEFNNVLQSIFLYAGLVQDELPENEDLRSNFQHILDDGNRASDLIKQILTFSRKTKVAMEPQPLHEMAMEVLVLERASLPATIEIKTDIDMNCGMVFCDKTQISQIIMNLCNNAQHAMEEKGGTLTVSLQQTQASMNNGDPETEALELKVSDTGQGIEAVDLKKIFDPFFTTKELGKGTGLGLSVIHGIVEMMDGQISITSEIGKGTTFRILFPVTEAVQEGDVIKSSAADVMSRSILLVDDEESIRSVTQIILARKGFKVDSASDGTQALELFKANPGKYDLIVTDQSMPKMSGVELTKAIRSTKSDIPIMLSTGQLGVEDETDFKDIGITAFIQKPWTAVELIERIRELGN